MSCGLKSITFPKGSIDRSDASTTLRPPQLKIKLRFPITCPLAVLLPLRSLSDSQDRPVAPAPSVCWPSSVSTSYSSCGLHGPSPTCFSFHRPVLFPTSVPISVSISLSCEARRFCGPKLMGNNSPRVFITYWSSLSYM